MCVCARAYTHVRTHTHTTRTHENARTHARAHTRTHAHARTHLRQCPGVAAEHHPGLPARRVGEATGRAQLLRDRQQEQAGQVAGRQGRLGPGGRSPARADWSAGLNGWQVPWRWMTAAVAAAVAARAGPAAGQSPGGAAARAQEERRRTAGLGQGAAAQGMLQLLAEGVQGMRVQQQRQAAA